jgi:3-deoxy-manno-octulosonate cytidylyltransferase (CMP-KDO synthetase)
MSGELHPVRQAPISGPIIIPARLHSSRLAEKLLLAETGRPLLAHVIERAQQVQQLAGDLVSDVIVACDDERLCDVARVCGVKALITSREHPNGTSRVAAAIGMLRLEDSVNFVINLQADQPELPAQDIVELARRIATDPSVQLATLAIAIRSGLDELYKSPHSVKVTLDTNRRASCFSRSPTGLSGAAGRTSSSPAWYYHVGVYAYRTAVLLRYAGLPATELERREDLEQLRMLEAGVPIDVVLMSETSPPQAVDTPENYAAFVRRWKDQCPGC